jgi:hypothetical protein
MGFSSSSRLAYDGKKGEKLFFASQQINFEGFPFFLLSESDGD